MQYICEHVFKYINYILLANYKTSGFYDGSVSVSFPCFHSTLPVELDVFLTVHHELAVH